MEITIISFCIAKKGLFWTSTFQNKGTNCLREENFTFVAKVSLQKSAIQPKVKQSRGESIGDKALNIRPEKMNPPQ